MHAAALLLLARCDGPHRVDGRPSLYAWARNTTAISRVAEFAGGVTDAVMAFAFEAGWSLAAVSVLDAPQRSFCLSRLTTECLATMDANVQRYYQKAGAREKQLQDSPVASLLGKRGKHSNAGAVSE